MVDSISHNQILTGYAHNSSRKEESSSSGNTTDGIQSKQKDLLSVKSESAQALTYSSDSQMVNGEDNKYGMLQSLVANLLKEQGIDTQIMLGDTTVDIATISQEEAQELVAEDGYFGVEQTSERIFQFAVGVAGGDPSRIDAIKEGVDKGFNEAMEAFGGKLPEISYETYDAVMVKLDNWVAESQGVA